ncbi:MULTISPECIES: lysophospholipid acyltransferase family protein [unclassified Janibacter]|uniref:lysophospholipid acyltransferase family protein n=1 Tax=unclassified Janibacter TaxID=2649294 RepID=UPI003D07AB77
MTAPAVAAAELALRHVVLGLPLRALTRLQVEGREHVPRTGPVIIASNHLSFMDSMVIPVAAGRPVRFIAKAEYWQGSGLKGRAMKAWFTTFGAVPVQRDDPRAAMQSLVDAEAVLREGDAFCIYPEGTRSRDGRLHKGRTGVGRLAVNTGAPVIPCAITGTDKVQGPDESGLRPAKVIVRFGPPVEASAFAATHEKAALLRAVTDSVMDTIAQLGGQETSGRYASDVNAEIARRRAL